MESNTIKRLNCNALYTVYYYDQLCKLWNERMRDRCTGVCKIWPREKPKLIHLDKLLKPSTSPKLEDGPKTRRRLINRRYYQKTKHAQNRKAMEKYHRLKKAA